MENKFKKVYEALLLLDNQNRFNHENLKIEDSRTLIAESKKINEGLQEILKEGEILKIGIVGQVKAGKSSFLNALFFEGKDILPKASTPMTAGLTVIRYAENPSFEIEFYTQEDFKVFEDNAAVYDKYYDDTKRENKEWTTKDIETELSEKLNDEICSSKELVDRCKGDARRKIGNKVEKVPFSDINEMQGRLIEYVGADGKYTSVTKSLFLYLNDERLKNIEIVDTPGVNDPVVSREERTKDFLRTCHGVFLLSYAGQLCSKTDIDFLETRINSQGIDAVVLLASKYDSALQEIGYKISDLERAHGKLERDLRQSFEDALKNTGYKGVKPKFDVTSGLCFSLYLKDKNSWDATERQVYSNLSELFPDYFNTDEEAKETLLGLSNIEVIREDYIEKEFKENKNKIIGDKISNYEEKNKRNLQIEIEAAKEKAVKQKKLLESSDLEKLKEDRESYQKMFSKIQGGISNTIKDAKQNLNNIAHSLGQTSWNVPSDIPRSRSTYSFKIESGAWLIPNDSYSCDYNEIDREAVRRIVKTNGTEYIDNVTTVWNDKFKKGGQFERDLKGRIEKEIENALEKQPKLDPEILQNALTEVLRNITSIQINSLTFTQNFDYDVANLKFPKRLTEAYNPNWTTFTESSHSSQVINAVHNTVEKLESEMRSTLLGLRTEVQAEAKKLFTSPLGKIEIELTRLDKHLVLTLEKEFSKQLDILEKDIKEKERVIPIFEDFIDTINNALHLIK